MGNIPFLSNQSNLVGMISQALERLRAGEMILLHDSSGREDEVDMIIPASATSAKTIRTMRKDAGGLICLAIGGDIAKKLNLPFMTDLLSLGNETVRGLIPERTAYGDKPAFSISINHKETFTGITDDDRSLTITEFAKLDDAKKLTENFYAPGHVHLLIAKSIEERRGHTELSIELARRAGIMQEMVLCEMMADNHKAASIDEVKGYADTNGLLFLDGGLL